MKITLIARGLPGADSRHPGGLQPVFRINTQQMTTERVSALQQKSALPELLEHLAGDQAGKVQAKFDIALDAARTMAHTFEVGKTPGRTASRCCKLAVTSSTPFCSTC
ncbi:MAG: hypothetical protein R2864_14760 [Syntrophotaleaceae bacterium]